MLFQTKKLTAKARRTWIIALAIVCMYVAIQASLGIAINVVKGEIVRDLRVLDQNAITSRYVEDMPETCPSGDYVTPMPKRDFPEEHWSMANIPTAHVSGMDWFHLA